jgi:DNA replication and repair protein RecF
MLENSEPFVLEQGSREVFVLEEVALRNYRNYAEQRVILSPGFNVFAGANAQGKTNFLEAIYLLATTRLLRGRKDAEAILEGTDQATVLGTLREGATQLSVTLDRHARKRCAINGLGLPRAADLIGRLPCVCMSAEDMAIVRGEPSDRRLFLDLELSALYPAYLRHLSVYKRAVEQRNSLLRLSREQIVPGEVFEPWEVQIAQHGTAMRHFRAEHVDRLRPVAQEIHRQMAPGEELALFVERNDEGELLDLLVQSRPTDTARGGTGVGPHRDDLGVEISGRTARQFGSQGQQRTAVIAIKVASLLAAREVLGAAPVLLLDDILSDLDEHRRAHLVEVVIAYARQAVLTCTEASAAGDRILKASRVFSVDAGTIRVE